MSPFDPAWEKEPSQPGAEFDDAVWAASLLAIDPVGLGGIALRAWSGPQRDEYLRRLGGLFPDGTAIRKMPLSISDDRLLGGLDLAATLQAGHPVMSAGLLAEAAGGVLLLAMAERLTPATAARLGAVVDEGAGFAMIALDEGMDADEAPPACLLDRLAFTVTMLPGSEAAWPARGRIESARKKIARVGGESAFLESICASSAVLGVASLRACLFALWAARAAAALRGRDVIAAEDVAVAVRLVLAPRATQMPGAEPDGAPQEQQPEDRQDEQESATAEAVEDSVAEAAQAVLPPELLAALAASGGPKRMARGAGKAGQTYSLKRGRPAGVRRGTLGGDTKLSLLETLRAAAPWQRLRARGGRKIVIRPDDFRVKKFKERACTIAIFAVDASGSSAVNRLAEAKGAIQLLLADCYVRRDQVALIAFRGREAECLLPPTHALARAKRALAGLPGGGPTPLATGIAAARVLAEAERRKGHLPLLVLLTDGGANIGRDGKPGRAAAGADALAAGKLCRAANISSLVVDTAQRPQASVGTLATAMGARYMPLPYADAARLSQAVQLVGGAGARSAA